MLAPLQNLFARDDSAAGGQTKVTLAQALKRGWLELWYQPKVSLQSGKLIGAEGLVRVRHPDLGVLGPGAFLPGAGEAEMLAMTERVIVAALRDWRECAAAGAPSLKLAVNVPASAFGKLPITQMIRDERPKSADWPGLILEVTEDQVVNDLKMAQEVANELRAQNCGLAIDDFGAGYSSLGRLKELPFTELKIDRAYVADCNTDKVKSGMLESIVELAHRFGLKSVAEGIETPYESHKLQGIGCVVGQGYLFAKPMAREDFLVKVERHTGQQRAPQRGSWFGAAKLNAL